MFAKSYGDVSRVSLNLPGDQNFPQSVEVRALELAFAAFVARIPPIIPDNSIVPGSTPIRGRVSGQLNSPVPADPFARDIENVDLTPIRGRHQSMQAIGVEWVRGKPWRMAIPLCAATPPNGLSVET
ncbi:hypothetical protein BP00DRAFT_449008 [Aspergillus indologenus CBS 114.80]|uniref:Uncharacterized protein n=1 Tax=Aspergillus indologenus CBS 114.80 TaxID=1450541 RepID=A0A2V5IK26_9EURO|nr:hypothetical protein BP00DRAFT_449008 [Aspergillus indologenus CBS 114.80]